MARRVPVASAVVGMVVAHAVDYALVHPQSSERAHHLSATGHGYWHAAVAAALVAAGALLLVALVEGARSGLGDGVRRPGQSRPLVTRVAMLAGCQMGLFCAVEVAERVAVGVDPMALLRQPELALGLFLQLVVAAVMTLVLDGVERVAGDAAALGAAARRREPSSSWERPATKAAGHRVAGRSPDARAPPQLAAV